MLFFLTLAVIGPYLLLTAIGLWVPRAELKRTTRARLGLSLLFLMTGSAHFTSTAAMSEMLPPFVPYRHAIIYLTGVFELMGAIGVWVPRMQRITGFCLIMMLIGVLPSNIYSAFARVDYGGHAYGSVYLLVRVPFQFLVIAWTYWATEQRWAKRPRARGQRPEPRTAPPRDPAGVA
jgi:uncharacterized membrane protein